MIIKYYHDQSILDCRPFRYSGCGGNTNSFTSGQECRQKCVYRYRNRTFVQPRPITAPVTPRSDKVTTSPSISTTAFDQSTNRPPGVYNHIFTIIQTDGITHLHSNFVKNDQILTNFDIVHFSKWSNLL